MNLICFGIFLVTYATAIEKETTWLSHLTSYIRKDTKIHNVVLLYDTETYIANHKIAYIVKEISINAPTWKINFQEAKSSNAEVLALKPQFYKPRSSLFVIIYSLDDCNLLELTGPMNYITRLSQTRSRPKCLFIIPQKTESCSYKVLLLRMWSRQFLDATVLEISKVKTRSASLVRLLNNQREIAVIHYYNPFNKTYTKKEYSKNNQLFPEKTYNLYDYELKVGFLHHPPGAVLKRDTSGKIQNVSGFGKLKITALSKKMNFRMIIPSEPKGWGAACDVIGKPGILHSLRKNQIQILALELGRFSTCEEKMFEWSRGLYPGRISLVVPSMQTTSTFYISDWKFLNSLVVISLPFLVLLVSRLFGFERKNWKLPYMFQILFATAVPREPDKLTERVVFGALLIMCFLNSSYIYTAFTDVGLRVESTYKFQTVEEILSSDLQVVITHNIYDVLYNSSEGNARLLLENVTMVDSKNFIDNLTQFKNAACLMKEDLARTLVAEKMDACGRTVMRILDKQFITAISGTAFSPGSPYVERMDVLLQRLLQSGISRKWELTSFRDTDSRLDARDSCNPKRIVESQNVAKQLFFILIFGFVSSVLIFLGELLIAYIFKV